MQQGRPDLPSVPLLLDGRCAGAELTALARALRGEARVIEAAEKEAFGLVDLQAEAAGRLYEVVQGIAYIPIRGALFDDEYISLYGWSGYRGLSTQIQHAVADSEVRALLLDISSFGGVVNGCFDLADEIYAARGSKPIIAAVNSYALSAAYAIASAADEVFLPRFGEVGSVGVWTMHTDQSALLERVGLACTLIFAGAHKVDGHPFGALPEAVRAEWQADVDRTRRIFAETVARNRGLSVEAVLATEARGFADDAAVGAGLADGVATFRSVATALAQQVAQASLTAPAP